MRRLLNLAGWLLAAVVVGLLLVLIVIPRVTGWVPLTVVSGSMAPSIPTGSTVVVQAIDGEAGLASIGTGDVITFLPKPNDPTLVTHRVVSSGARGDGSVIFVTRGDANGAPDADPIGGQQVRGKVRYHVPYAGYLSTLLDVEQKKIGVVLLAGALFLYAGMHAVLAIRSVLRRRD